MKKLLSITVTLFLATIFSCNKSEIVILAPDSFESKEGFRNLNVLLFDKGHFQDKMGKHPDHIHLFTLNYQTDGSKALIKSNLAFGLVELQENEEIPPGSPTFSREEEIPWAYCMNDGTEMTGFFLDYFVSDKLRKNKPALEEFRIWFENIVVDWMNDNDLGPKVKHDKPGEYWIKIIGKVD